ncbi:MAG: hypothetical protein HOW73_41140 [Polyangiaceae bacterium]|nr:hypothetical protein [Polyangiaceae bacterium]
MDVLFDTSALSNLLEQRAPHRFAALFLRAFPSGRVLVPLEALAERSSQVNISVVEGRVRALSKLATALKESFAISPGGTEVVRELEHAGALVRAPVLAQREQDEILDHYASEGFSKTHPPVARRLREGLRKDNAAAMLAKLKAAIAQRIPTRPTPAELDEYMADFCARLFKPDGHFLRLVAVDAQHAEAIRTCPSGYPAATTLIGYSEFHFISAAFRGMSHGAHTEVLGKPSANDLVDATIAAAAAHSELLITDDRAMRARVNALGEMFDLPTRAQTLETFMAHLEANQHAGFAWLTRRCT